MYSCPQCPGRSFKDADGARMHRESKHPGYHCEHCSKQFNSQQALEQHAKDKHPFFQCSYCNREFTTANGRDAHEQAKHPSMFECHYCDREFGSEEARQQHEDAKHTFECRYCDCQFNSEQAREQHEDDKHTTIECRYCDREFGSEEARRQHENAKHTFECHYCDCQFNSEQAREQHEDDKHTTIECRYCDREFGSEGARQQHEEAKHYSEYGFRCSYCGLRKFSQSKTAHEASCSFNPANHVVRPSSTDIVGEESSPSIVTQSTDEGSEAPSPRSSHDEGETFHSTSTPPSVDANGEGATITQHCTRACSLTPCMCSICRRASSLLSGTEEPVLDDVESVVSVDEDHQDDTKDHRDVIFQCTPCLKLFESERAFRDHVCAFRTALPRPHCPVCYTQFDDGPSLQKHLEGLQSFICQLCLTQCCSDEMLQDHLLSHPTCGKCGKSFADNLALCAHVESDHPVVVCWDCDGIVVEKNSLDLHYADSSAHPTCALCGVGKRNSADMIEHIKHVHAGVEIEGKQGGGGLNARLDEPAPSAETEADREDPAPHPLEQLGRVPLSSGVDTGNPLGGPGDEPHTGPLQAESSLSSPPQAPMAPQIEHADETARKPSVINGAGTPDVGLRQYASPSPTPSEHGSDVCHQLVASKMTNAATNDDTRLPSPDSSASAESFSDLSTQSSPTSSSSNSVVFVSADGIPDFIRENRAILVATSAGSPSSGRTPLRLSSSSSLDSLDVTGPRAHETARVSAEEKDGIGADVAAPRTGATVTYRLHCRICLRDPCQDMTATICGHLFCKRCITQAVIEKPACPVCESATLLYCLFKLDLSV